MFSFLLLCCTFCHRMNGTNEVQVLTVWPVSLIKSACMLSFLVIGIRYCGYYHRQVEDGSSLMGESVSSLKIPAVMVSNVVDALLFWAVREQAHSKITLMATLLRTCWCLPS